MTRSTDRSKTYGIAPAAFAFPPLSTFLATVGLELFLAYILLTLAALSAWWAWARHRKRLRNARHNARLTDSAGAPRLSSDRDTGPLSPVTAGHPHALAQPPPAETPIPEQIFFPADSQIPPRSCPLCERTFPGIFKICPFDTTPLIEGILPKRQASPTPLPRRFCPECDRRFGREARFCYRDGTGLVEDFTQASDIAPAQKACPSCGYETFDTDQKTCPRDGEDLLLLDPSDRDLIPPAFPFNRCLTCGHIGPPSQTECPVDAGLMLPQLNARQTELPPTGFGPRRRICDQCGAQFGDAAHFCSFDQNELTPIN